MIEIGLKHLQLIRSYKSTFSFYLNFWGLYYIAILIYFVVEIANVRKLFSVLFLLMQECAIMRYKKLLIQPFFVFLNLQMHKKQDFITIFAGNIFS